MRFRAGPLWRGPARLFAEHRCVMLSRLYDNFLSLLGLSGGVAFGAMALMVGADVVLRNLGLPSMPWLLEVVEYALFIVTFLVAPAVLHQGAHVRVDVLVANLPAGAARIMNMLADLVGLFSTAALCWYGWRVTEAAYVREELIFKELVIPEWWLLMFVPLGSALLAVEFARRLAMPASVPDDQSAGLKDGL